MGVSISGRESKYGWNMWIMSHNIISFSFTLETSHYARDSHEEDETSPYTALYVDIVKLPSHRKLLLVGEVHCKWHQNYGPNPSKAFSMKPFALAFIEWTLNTITPTHKTQDPKSSKTTWPL